MMLLKDVGNESVLLMIFSDFFPFLLQLQAQPVSEEKEVLFNSVISAEQCAFVVQLPHQLPFPQPVPAPGAASQQKPQEAPEQIPGEAPQI